MSTTQRLPRQPQPPYMQPMVAQGPADCTQQVMHASSSLGKFVGYVVAIKAPDLDLGHGP
eukprot:2666349-Amphidinium_carterae.1